MFHLGGEKFDFGAQVFDSDGDIEKKEGEQTNGYTGKFEYSIFEDFRLGLSYLAESDKNENTKTMYATTIKSRVGKGSSVMLEVGRIVNDIKASGEITSNYIFLQNHMKLARGLNFLFTYQYYQADTDKESEVFTFAPGIQYYPWQRVETRAEIQNTRSVDDDENTPVASLSESSEDNVSNQASYNLDETADELTAVVENTTTEQNELAEVPEISTAIFTFAGDCWVSIYDATGERIAYGVKKPGYVMTITGQAPFKVDVGRPALTSIEFNGETIDMSQFDKDNIAKFTLPIVVE